jgi:hypothetical protein
MKKNAKELQNRPIPRPIGLNRPTADVCTNLYADGADDDRPIDPA